MSISAVSIGLDPPFARITVSGQTVPSWSVVRVVGAQTEVVRGGRDLSGPGTVLDDTEAPLNVPLHYRVLDNSDQSILEETSASVTLTAPGYVYLTDPVSLARAQTQAETWPELSYPFRGSVFRAVGRPNPIVVSDVRAGAEGEVELFTSTSPQRDAILDLLQASIVFQLRALCPEVWQGYWAVTDMKEQRETNSGSDPRRRWLLTLVQADRPDLDLIPTTDTLMDLHLSLGGDGVGTLLILSQNYPGTLLDVAAASLSTLAGP